MQEDSVIQVVLAEDAYNSLMAGRPPTHDAPAFGQRLAALRKERGWTQPQLAQKIGVTVKTITYYERLASNPTSKTIERLAKVFDVSSAELLGDACEPIHRKPGPPSRFQQLVDQLSDLPRSKQKFVLEFLNNYLRNNQHQQAA